MPQHIYGVVDADGKHTDVSKTERGAKQYATRHNYNKVSIRYNCGYNVALISTKQNGKWIKSTN